MNLPSPRIIDSPTPLAQWDKRPLAYMGSQWNITPWILQTLQIPTHLPFAEVFGGGASVLLQKPKASKELLNEINPLTFLFFQVLRDYPEDLCAAIGTLLSYENPFVFYVNQMSDFYHLHQLQAPLDMDQQLVYAATYWIYAHASYRGAGDKWSSGLSKDRWNRVKGFPVSYQLALQKASLRLSTPPTEAVHLTNLDAFQLISSIADKSPTTYLYLDPPYPNHVRSGKDRREGRKESGMTRMQYKYDMKEDATHAKLLTLLLSIQNPFAICTYDNSLYDSILLDPQAPRVVIKSTKPVRDISRGDKVLALYYTPTF